MPSRSGDFDWWVEEPDASIGRGGGVDEASTGLPRRLRSIVLDQPAPTLDIPTLHLTLPAGSTRGSFSLRDPHRARSYSRRQPTAAIRTQPETVTTARSVTTSPPAQNELGRFERGSLANRT